MNSQVTENYLKALFNISQEQEEIPISRLAESMDVSIPTAHSMIKKLHQQELVHYEKYKPIRLTHRGQKTSALIVRKHRLIEMFLVQIMGMGWEEVHDIAEQIEHVDSPLFFQKMDAMLGFPTVDPHGSPIPTLDGQIKLPDREQLSDQEVGDKVQLVAIGQSSQALLQYLNRKKISLGAEMLILDKEEFDGSITLKLSSGAVIHLSKDVSDSLLVTAC